MFLSTKEGLALALPAAIFSFLLFLVPVGILLSEAFKSDVGWTISGYTEFFSKPLNRTVFFRTLKLGVLVAGTSAIIG